MRSSPSGMHLGDHRHHLGGADVEADDEILDSLAMWLPRFLYFLAGLPPRVGVVETPFRRTA